MQTTRGIRKSGSKLLGIWLFLSILLLKEAFPKPAYAFLSSRDSCLAQPQCAAAIAEEAVTAVAAPTASGVSATIGATTATGVSTTTQVAAGVAMVGDLRLSGIAAYYLWSQAVNGQAQEIARQKYCAAYPFDAVCGPPAQGFKVRYSVNFQNKGYWEQNFQTRENSYLIWGPVEGIVREEKNPSPGYYHVQIYIRGRDSLGNVKDYWTQGASGGKGVLGTDSRITRILRFDGQPETDPPPLPWEDWPQQKRSIAVASLTNSDWQGLIKSMPVGGRLIPGDTVNAPTIVIPGQPEDDPNTPADERLLRKDQGFFNWPGLPDTDLDGDSVSDTDDPEPQNPNVPVASENPPEPSDPAPSPSEPTISERDVIHIFRDAPGHLPEDTPENRELLINTASNPNNYLGSDQYGNEWYGETRPDGTQAWTRVRNRRIINGGVNPTPREFNPYTGLNDPPMQQ